MRRIGDNHVIKLRRSTDEACSIVLKSFELCEEENNSNSNSNINGEDASSGFK